MLSRQSQSRRRGAVLFEAAVVYSVFFLLTIGVIVIGLGVFHSHQMASLAREGARYASVRGAQYATDTDNAAATTGDVTAYVKSKAAGLVKTSLTVTTTWNANNRLTHTSGGATLKNTVTVKVSYSWIPEAFFGGMTLTSTSVVPMSY